MAGVEQTVAEQPVIKDVETLKANLKEEKRVRSETEEPIEKKEGEEVKDGVTPASTEVQKPESDEERRKRRKVGDATNGQETVAEPIDLTDKAQDPVLDGPISPSKVAPPHKESAALPTNGTTEVSDEIVAPARSFPETADLEAKKAEETAAKTGDQPALSNGKVTGNGHAAPGPVEQTEKVPEAEPTQPLAAAWVQDKNPAEKIINPIPNWSGAIDTRDLVKNNLRICPYHLASITCLIINLCTEGRV